MTARSRAQERNIAFQRRLAIGLFVFGLIVLCCGIATIVQGVSLHDAILAAGDHDRRHSLLGDQVKKRFELLTHLGPVFFGLGLFCVLVAIIVLLDIRRLLRDANREDRQMMAGHLAARRARFPTALMDFLARDDIAAEISTRLQSGGSGRVEAATSMDLDDLSPVTDTKPKLNSAPSSFRDGRVRPERMNSR